MKSKEEIAILWLVVIIAGLMITAIFPLILVFIVLGYCAWGLYTHYSNKN
jgi:heme/copper-type cytochrome/quinol oxidase subunit 2